MRCECTKFSIDHKEGQCSKKATVYVRRDDRSLAVCEDCIYGKDIILRDVEPDE